MYVVSSEPSSENEQRANLILPVQATPLIGRHRQVESARMLLVRPDVRLVTMTGPPGAGKTRLSLQVAVELAGHFPDGVYFVALAPTNNPVLAVSAISQALGLKETSSRDLYERLKEYLRNRELLLLLDNLEQVESAAPLVSDLLKAAPRLKLLVTSRTLLRVYGEHDFPVHPFALPSSEALTHLEAVADNEAVQLFVQRAKAARPDFALTEENFREVAEICRLLDGLPLAIELAAARVRLLPPQVMFTRLKGWGQRLHLLKDGAQDLPTRQQTLRDAISWSFDLLDGDEQQLLMQLSVFVGGFTLDAAETVAAGSEPGPLASDTLDGISSLANKSLLQQDAACSGEPRFTMLQTIREFALERLDNQGIFGRQVDIQNPKSKIQNNQGVRLRHARYFLDMAEKGDIVLQGLVPTTHFTACLERLEREHDNIRAALDWSLDRQEGDRELGVRMACALWMFWEMHGHLTEGREWASLALTRLDQVPDSEVRNPKSKIRNRARLLLIMGKLSMWQGAFDLSRSELEESLSLCREAGDKWGAASALVGLGHVSRAGGNYSEARACFEESLSLRKELGHKTGVASALHGMGDVAFFEGDYDGSIALLEESLSLAREMGHKWVMIHSFTYMGFVTLRGGDYARSTSAFREGLALSMELGDKIGITRCCMGLAEVACAQEEWKQAARLFGAASAWQTLSGAWLYLHFREEYEQKLASARAALGEPEFTRLWEAGRSMSPDALTIIDPNEDERERAERGLRVVGFEPNDAPHASDLEPDARTPQSIDHNELSSRELEVLQLIAMGLTNAEIANRLIISSHTVNNHLRSIFRKLGVASRSAATRYAVVHKLA